MNRRLLCRSREGAAFAVRNRTRYAFKAPVETLTEQRSYVKCCEQFCIGGYVRRFAVVTRFAGRSLRCLSLQHWPSSGPRSPAGSTMPAPSPEDTHEVRQGRRLGHLVTQWLLAGRGRHTFADLEPQVDQCRDLFDTPDCSFGPGKAGGSGCGRSRSHSSARTNPSAALTGSHMAPIEGRHAPPDPPILDQPRHLGGEEGRHPDPDGTGWKRDDAHPLITGRFRTPTCPGQAMLFRRRSTVSASGTSGTGTRACRFRSRREKESSSTASSTTSRMNPVSKVRGSYSHGKNT